MSREGGVAAVERALSILSAFREEDESLALADLAERTGLYKSTILRLLTSLERHFHVIRLANGRYRLGPALLHLGTLYLRSFRLEDHVAPVLRRIAAESGESVSFYRREGESRICLFRADSTRGIRHHVQVGDLLPLEEGAAGRVLVAFAAGTTEVEPELLHKLPVVVAGDYDPDITAISAPVFGLGGVLAGTITVSGPRTRLTPEVIEEISPSVMAGVRSLTAELGGDPTVFGDTPTMPQRKSG